MTAAKKQAAPAKPAAKKDEPKNEVAVKKDEKVQSVTLPALPEGQHYVAVSLDYCPNGTCPLHLDNATAYLETAGLREGEQARRAEIAKTAKADLDDVFDTADA